jgi:ABC-2 type transport system ATP-binding protein
VTLDPAFVADPTIEVTNASKWFGQKVAVSGLSCSFGPGVTGLLGPNGAGKTTLFRMISGLTSVSNGSITVLGKNPRTDVSVFASVALVPDEDAVYDDLTGRQFVRYSADLSSVENREAVDDALNVVQMSATADRTIAGYSKGMRQRIKIAAALVTDPDILILDEPLNGTDPIQRAHLIALFESFGVAGKTVIVSSHVLEEVERVCDNVVALDAGHLIAQGSMTDLAGAEGGIEVEFVQVDDRPDAIDDVVRRLEASGAIVQRSATTLSILGADDDELFDRAADAIADAGARVRRLGQRRRTLDDLFEAHALEGAAADAPALDASGEQS